MRFLEKPRDFRAYTRSHENRRAWLLGPPSSSKTAPGWVSAKNAPNERENDLLGRISGSRSFPSCWSPSCQPVQARTGSALYQEFYLRVDRRSPYCNCVGQRLWQSAANACASKRETPNDADNQSEPAHETTRVRGNPERAQDQQVPACTYECIC